MLKIKCDINRQYLKTVDLHFVKSKFRLNNLAVKGLKVKIGLKGLAQAKIIKKSVILFRVLNMTI